MLPFTGGVILPTLKLDLILLTVHTISLGIATTLTFVSLKYLGKTVNIHMNVAILRTKTVLGIDQKASANKNAILGFAF